MEKALRIPHKERETIRTLCLSGVEEMKLGILRGQGIQNRGPEWIATQRKNCRDLQRVPLECSYPYTITSDQLMQVKKLAMAWKRITQSI